MPQEFTVWFFSMLAVDELSKNYGDFVAVDRVSFSAGKGAVFGSLAVGIIAARKFQYE